MGKNWSLSQFLFLQEHWERCSSRVLSVDLLNLNSTIRKEVVENVVLVTTIVGSILPQDIEAQNFSVIVKEAFESLIWSSSLELHFDVLFDLSLIWWGLLHVDHGSSLGEQVLWVAFGSIEWSALVGVESSSEVIAVNDSDYSIINVEVDSNIQILPDVVFGLVMWVWEFVSLQEDSLWDTGVLDSWLEDVDGVVIKIVEENALSNSVVLVGVLNDWFLEIALEGENLNHRQN